MPIIVFEGGAGVPAMSVEMTDGGALVDVCDEASAPVVFSCRSATCAICRIDVTDGDHLLEPPGEDELRLLKLVQAPPMQRLACQAFVRTGPGLIRLRSIVKIT